MAVTLADVLAELRGLRLELRAACGSGAAPGARDGDDVRAIHAIVAALPPTARFTARSVLEHAAVNGALHLALERADAENAKSLGRLLCRVEGHVIGAVRVARVRRGRAGVTWRLEPV